MTIENAILGLLSWQPLAGYDLKKIISESDMYYWSGNNNQIYNTLVQLHRDGLVTQQVQQQESLPPRKVYTITAQGRDELRRWVLSVPELPELRSTFFIQLAWADQLSGAEMDALLARYEEEIEVRVRMQHEQARHPPASRPDRTPREAFLWEQIAARVLATYQAELDWVRQVRQGLKGIASLEGI